MTLLTGETISVNDTEVRDSNPVLKSLIGTSEYADPNYRAHSSLLERISRASLWTMTFHGFWL